MAGLVVGVKDGAVDTAADPNPMAEGVVEETARIRVNDFYFVRARDCLAAQRANSSNTQLSSKRFGGG